MSPERSEFVEMMRTRKQFGASRDMTSVRTLAQAEVTASKLTNDPNWDTFLQVLQPRLDEMTARQDGLARRIALADVGERDEIIAEAVRLQAGIEVLEWAMSVPGQMLNEGRKAAEILKEADAEAESA